MEVSPTTSKPRVTVKRAAPKAKPPVIAAPPKPVLRKPRLTTTPGLSESELSGMIATAAYHLAAARGFAPGHEINDWLTAEKTVLAQYR